MSIFRDPIWQFVGVILSLATIFITLYIFWRQRSLRQIACEVVSNSTLISISNEIESDIQIQYKGKTVRDLRLVIIKVQNLGNSPISNRDFEEPLQFFFGEDADILEVELVESSPSSLVPQITNNVNHLTIKPLLLNPKDSFTLKIIALRASEKIDVIARIFGVRDITRIVPNSPPLVIPWYFLIILMMTLITFGFLLSNSIYDVNDLQLIQSRLSTQQSYLQTQESIFNRAATQPYITDTATPSMTVSP